MKEIQKSSDEDIKVNMSQQLEECLTEGSSEHLMLPRHEVIKRLRERGEPILLYGESEIEAFKRLRKCEILEPEVNKVCIIMDDSWNYIKNYDIFIRPKY